VPKLAIIDVPAKDAAPAPLAAYILAVMYYPDDTDLAAGRRLHFLKTIEAQGPLKQLVGVESALVYLKGARKEGSKLAVKGDGIEIDGGVLAALILLLPLVMAVRRQKIIGRRASMLAWEALLTEKGVKGASLRNLEKVWAKYRSVAHFWVMLLMAGEMPVGKDLTDDQPIRTWLAAAEELREMAEAHKPPTSAWSLVEPGVMWWLPDELVPPIKFGVDRLIGNVELPSDLIEAALAA
jgi:hypothetical protein